MLYFFFLVVTVAYLHKGGRTHHTVDGQELVPSLQAAVPLGHAAGDDAGDVDGGVLLLAAHHVEAQPFLRLGQLHHSRVGVTFAGREGRHRCLKEERRSFGLLATNWTELDKPWNQTFFPQK